MFAVIWEYPDPKEHNEIKQIIYTLDTHEKAAEFFKKVNFSLVRGESMRLFKMEEVEL